MPDEILDIAHGDIHLAARIREILVALADHDNAEIREMSREVLAGASLRRMAASSVYGDEIGAAFGRFWQTYQTMDPGRRTELEEAGRSVRCPI
ncbi:hypothetical protein [Actinoplanes couchii]|nr:hypothetical protein [Actinoplanes couchii]MDR6321962.1 hypothetical protein [Actinoplanes couchii]